MLDAVRAFAKIIEQHALGPRLVGSPGHAQAHTLLGSWLTPADTFREHTFTGTYFGKEVTCRNLHGHFGGNRPGRVLLGSHFDTRPWADNDANPANRRLPVPGANDGASGVAVLAELVSDLTARRDRPSVDIVFFDAEDWHDIDGHRVSEGSQQYVSDLDPHQLPDQVVIVDMVAGRDLMFDVDVSCQDHAASQDLTVRLFKLGAHLGLSACSLRKPTPYKFIGCDHTPFMAIGVPSAILIDIDYPQWHTVLDLPEACATASLAQVARLLDAYLFMPPADG